MSEPLAVGLKPVSARPLAARADAKAARRRRQLTNQVWRRTPPPLSIADVEGPLDTRGRTEKSHEGERYKGHKLHKARQKQTKRHNANSPQQATQTTKVP